MTSTIQGPGSSPRGVDRTRLELRAVGEGAGLARSISQEPGLLLALGALRWQMPRTTLQLGLGPEGRSEGEREGLAVAGPSHLPTEHSVPDWRERCIPKS